MIPFEKSVELLLQIILEVIKDQPPEVKKELWLMYLEDVKKWREFWQSLGVKKND